MLRSVIKVLILSRAPAADVENKRPGREETASPPPAVEEKRQPVVSSPHVPAPRNISSPAPTPRPPPDRTEDEDEYDSDDASKTDCL